MKKIPKIKKRINAFLLNEEGKVSKKNMFKTGVLFAGASTLIVTSASMTESSQLAHTEKATMEHSSHGSHASHASHASHGSHGSHGSW